MKSKKVLLGLIVTAFVGLAGIAGAQTKANFQNKLIEVGPDNVSGRSRAIIVDQRDASHKTLYAGGVAGGLYKFNSESASWTYIPYMVDGKEVTLPISHMIQTSDNMIFIATGEGLVLHEKATKGFLAPKGLGLVAFNPDAENFTVIPGTASITYINKLTAIHRNNTLFLYAATESGLYRWAKEDNADWPAQPEEVFTEGPVQDVEIISGDNMAFFTSGSHLYKISNVVVPATTNKYTDISATCSAFGGTASRIELAAAKSDRTYIYASVADEDGLLKGVYRTTNQQTWFPITTATITPFNSKNLGDHNNAMAIDPTNHQRVLLGGASLWVGEGFADSANYQWNKVSSSEDELNGGNYMGNVYPSTFFVHSGIHEILPVPQIENGDTSWVYYFATDGGIYKSIDNCNSFTSINKGFNTVQYNGIAVAPDGSLLGGAVDNACPFIQSRNDHNNAPSNDTWYDNGSTMNHLANIYWFGNGGQVEASMFQQVLPQSRRGLFFSAQGSDYVLSSGMGDINIANFGRSFADYSDYTNTQTWTIFDAFLEKSIASTNTIPQMALWETTNNKANDSILVNLDTLGTFFHDGVEISFADGAMLQSLSSDPSSEANRWAKNFVFQPGDYVVFGSKPHFNYPFTYTFEEATPLLDAMHLKLHNPIASRMFLSGTKNTGQGVVTMTMSATDFSKVYSDAESTLPSRMHWYEIYKTIGGSGRAYETTGYIAVANDGDAVYINVIDTLGANYMVRVSNLNACDANDYTQGDFDINYSGTTRLTSVDTIVLSNNNFKFDRPITSLYVDRRSNKDVLLITFGGDTTGLPNLCVVNNASNPANRTISFKTVANGEPVYTGLIEYTTGTYYVGTASGVYTASEASMNGTPSWEVFGAFNGVPVTSIRQQVQSLPRRRYVTHTGINAETYLFAKTKYPYAIYFGTYGRGIFMDKSYVTDTVNEIVDPEDYVGISTVNKGENFISVYPNPATAYTNVDMTVVEGGNGVVKVYDLSGKMVFTKNLGRVNEGKSLVKIDCQNLPHGMYLINVNIGKQSATSKLIVR